MEILWGSWSGGVVGSGWQRWQIWRGPQKTVPPQQLHFRGSSRVSFISVFPADDHRAALLRQTSLIFDIFVCLIEPSHRLCTTTFIRMVPHTQCAIGGFH